MKVKLLGAHNCETLDTRLSCVIIDDVIALDAGSLTSGLTLEDQKNLEAVVLTHRHYDHIRDIPALGMNLYLSDSSMDIYATREVTETINKHFLGSGIYKNFAAEPKGNPTLRFHDIEPLEEFRVAGCDLLAVPVRHSAPTNGCQVATPDGKAVFYTGDTGPGLEECWRHIAPQLIIIEVTSSNRFERFCADNGHLAPVLLGRELESFRKVKGYLPDVITVHMSPELEDEIQSELAGVADTLDCRIIPGDEGMEFIL
jgi:ribonuclease BN (tRNA processing enzyme)